MAGNKRPSFLKRQKEQARKARATEKREARRARKQAAAEGLIPANDEFGQLESFDSEEPVEEVEPAEDEKESTV